MTSNAKHAFRFFFRSEYGPAKLKYPVFGKAAAQQFDNIDLRTFSNYSWSLSHDPRCTFMRDQFNRDLQLAMGQSAARGYFCHLYINGQYWGLFNTCERPEASFGESYFKGKADDFDVIKIGRGRGRGTPSTGCSRRTATSMRGNGCGELARMEWGRLRRTRNCWAMTRTARATRTTRCCSIPTT